MNAHWHPLSAVYLVDPPTLATPTLVRMLLASAGGIDVVYGGDRMWPTIEHGSTVRVRSADPSEPPEPGSVVLCAPGGIPDLLRAAPTVSGSLRVVADADPDTRPLLAPGDLLGVTSIRGRVPPDWLRRVRRWWLDLRETGQGPDRDCDAAATVQRKYDVQAPFYAREDGPGLEPRLVREVRRRVRGGGRILVLGSGVGRECRALARLGFQVVGLDFSDAMVRLARDLTATSGMDVAYVCGDVRSHEEERGSLDAVFFTYDVYSFLPERRERREVLGRIRRWLRGPGTVFLSARVERNRLGRAILLLQSLRRGWRQGSGKSHTRWLGPDGRLHRSFVQVFSAASLRRELERGGFRIEGETGGHVLLSSRAREPAGKGSG